MPRIRTIKPEVQHSETLGRVSRDARLTFILMWPQADDDGRLRANSRMLASVLFPYDDDAPARMDGWLTELEDVGCIRRYEVDGSKYIDIPKWLEHQKIDHPKPSKFPAFAEASRSVANVREKSPRTKEGTKDLGPRTHPSDDAGASSGVTTANGSPVVEKSPEPEPDLKTRIFGPLREWLVRQSGKTDAQCRAMLGRWTAKHGEAQTIEAVTQAARNAPLDPIPYVERIFSNGKSTKPTARGSATAHAAGLAAALRFGGLDARNAAAGATERPAISRGDLRIDGRTSTGDDGGLRSGDAGVDRIRGGIRGAVPGPGDRPVDLPRDAGGPAGGSADDSDCADQNQLDVGQSDAVSGGNSSYSGGRFEPPKTDAFARRNGAEKAFTSAQGQRDFGRTVGRTETAYPAHRAEQPDHKSVADLLADHKLEKTGQGRASDSDGPSPYQTGQTCEPSGKIFNPGGMEIRLEVAS